MDRSMARQPHALMTNQRRRGTEVPAMPLAAMLDSHKVYYGIFRYDESGVQMARLQKASNIANLQAKHQASGSSIVIPS